MNKVVDLGKLNRCNFTDSKNLPHICGVYVVAAVNNEVLYVGMSENLNQRWRSHHRAKEVKALGASHIYYLPLLNEQLAIETEIALIAHFQPRLNNTPVTYSVNAKPRVMVYLDPEINDFLRQWAESEHRSVNNLITMLLDQAITSKQGEK